MRRYFVGLLSALMLGGLLLSGCGDSKPADTGTAASGQLSPADKAHEEQRVKDMEKRYKK